MEYEKERVRFLPKNVRHRHDKGQVPPVIIPSPAGPAFERAVRRQETKPASEYASDSTYTYPSVKITRSRQDKVIKKKVESTLLYKPKFPSYPAFRMCRFSDFDVSTSNKLGKGGFGNVFLGRHRATGVPVAIKLISHTSIEKSPKHVENEETIHGRLYNPFIARFYCTMADPVTSDIYFVLEYADGPNLAKKISKSHPIPHGHIQKWVAQIVLGLEYLHDQCIVYRDMKAENVIIDEDNNAKLIDFGLSVFDCNNELKNVAGTLEYTAPEMASRLPHGRAIDYYGLGILLFTIKTGRLPYSFKSSGLDKKGYLKKIATRTSLSTTSDPLYDLFIARLCDPDPNTRWGVSEQSRKELRLHPFFDGINWATLEKQVISFKQYESTSLTTSATVPNSVSLDGFISSGQIKKLAGPTK